MTPWKRIFKESDSDKVKELATLYKDGEKKNSEKIRQLEKELMSSGVLVKNHDGTPGEFSKKSDFDKFHSITKHIPPFKESYFFKSRILKEWVDEFVESLIDTTSLPDEASKNTAEDDLKKQLDRISHMLHKQGEVPQDVLYDILTSNKKFMDFYDKSTQEHGEADWNQFILQWGDLLADIQEYNDPAKEYE